MSRTHNKNESSSVDKTEHEGENSHDITRSSYILTGFVVCTS